jgi:hypothetical protein
VLAKVKLFVESVCMAVLVVLCVPVVVLAGVIVLIWALIGGGD